MKLKFKTIGALSVASALNALVPANGAASADRFREANISDESQGESTDTPHQLSSSSDACHTHVTDITWKETLTEWGKKEEKEFRKLVEKDVAGKINNAEFNRLEYLQDRRNALKSPRTSEEILIQWQRDDALETLNQALQKYVRYQRATDYKTKST